MKPKIKILVTYKEKHKILKSEILTPIQTGRAISDEIFDDMIGDDTGENISILNDKFSELSAIYWAWKNYDKLGNPDYIGHMHYRRQFLFDTSKLKLVQKKYSSFYEYLSIDALLLNSFSDDKIYGVISKYDFLIPDWHITPTKNIKMEYAYNIPGGSETIFDEFIKICKQLRPEYINEIEQVETGNKVAVCNMFIMKKDIFFQYCEFAFQILFELEKRIDSSKLKKDGLRFCGYMAEKLQTIFIFHLLNKNLKFKFLDCSFVFNPDDYPMSFLKIRKIFYKLLSFFNKKYQKKFSLYKEITRYRKAQNKIKKIKQKDIKMKLLKT